MIDEHGWRYSDHIVILYFHPYACGKFLSNVLSFNDNFIPQISFTDQVERYNRDIEILNTKDVFDDPIENFLREYKIKEIFLTIPPTQQACRDWWAYELGCKFFWNFNANNIDDSDVLDAVHQNCLHLLRNQKYCFIVAHDIKQLQSIKKYFSNAKILELINDERVYQASVALKSDGSVHRRPNPIQQESIKFDIDCLFDQDKFFQNIKELLDKFPIKDASLDPRVFEYYKNYVKLYEGVI